MNPLEKRAVAEAARRLRETGHAMTLDEIFPRGLLTPSLDSLRLLCALTLLVTDRVPLGGELLYDRASGMLRLAEWDSVIEAAVVPLFGEAK